MENLRITLAKIFSVGFLSVSRSPSKALQKLYTNALPPLNYTHPMEAMGEVRGRINNK
jgi:hypothetical protein